MRSCALAWLLQEHGDLEAVVLKGGYKAFRKWQHELYCYLEPNAGYKFVVPQPPKKSKKKPYLKKKKPSSEGDSQAAPEEEAAPEPAPEPVVPEVSEEEAAVKFSAELALKQAGWEGSHRSGPRVVIVAGRTGVGKTKARSNLELYPSIVLMADLKLHLLGGPARFKGTVWSSGDRFRGPRASQRLRIRIRRSQRFQP